MDWYFVEVLLISSWQPFMSILDIVMIRRRDWLPIDLHDLAVIVHVKKNLQGSLVPHGEGSGTPLQYSCLENPMDGGA